MDSAIETVRELVTSGYTLEGAVNVSAWLHKVSDHGLAQYFGLS